MNYYDQIKTKIIDNEIYQKVKDYSKERNTVLTYYEIGKLLNEAGSQYGEHIIEEYSKKLMNEVGKKYNARTLRRMKQLYLFFKNQKWSPLGTELSISHIRTLFTLNDTEEINYYAQKVIHKNLSKRELEKIVKSHEYERLPLETKNKLINDEKLEVQDLVPNPILIKKEILIIK